MMSLNQDRIIAGLVATFVLSAVFAFLGVYDSNTMPFLQRLFFWGSTISTGVVTGLLFSDWIFKGPLAEQNTALKLIVLSAIVSIPVVIVLAAFSGGLTGGWPLYNWPLQFFLSFFIAIILNTGAYVALKAADWAPSSITTTSKSTQPGAQFLQRLPIKYHQATLYAVSSEDHYIRVHTDHGEELILMRLSDALKELSEADGLQTHRSWWVARAGIAESISKHGKHSLRLQTGTVAPISRSFSKAVREAYFN